MVDLSRIEYLVGKEKIELLKEALKNATESFGENDRRTQAWAEKLNNAEADRFSADCRALFKEILNHG